MTHRSLRFVPLFTALAALAPSLLFALDGVVFLPDGRPAASSLVTVVGHPQQARTDGTGTFHLRPDPTPPFEILVIGSAGEIYTPVRVTATHGERLKIRLAAAYSEEVTVATGSAPSIFAPPASAMSMISSEEARQKAAEHVADLLQEIPGAGATEGGAASVPSLRGLARGRTLILIDGARVISERRAGPSATFLDPSILEGVDVTRGPGSVAYGSDAFGGVINARLREPDPSSPSLFRWTATAMVGGARGAGASIDTGGALFGGAYLAIVHARAAGEEQRPDGARIDDSSYEDAGGLFRFASDARGGRALFTLAFDRGRDIGKPSIDSATTGAVYPVEESFRSSARLELPSSGAWSGAALELFAGNYRLVLDRTRYATPGAEQQLDRSDVRSTDASLRFSGTRAIGEAVFHGGADVQGRLNLHARSSRVAGAGPEAETVDDERSIEDADRIDGALFGVLDTRIARYVTLGAGLRADGVRSRNRGGFAGDHSQTHFAPSGHLALVLGGIGGLTSSIQVSSGFREPTLSDRYFHGPSGRGFVTGNPDLDPERSLQLDATIRWDRGEAALTLAGYDYRIDDLVERYRSGSDFFFRNRGEARIRGVELEGVVPLVPRRLAAHIGASISRGEADGRDTIDGIVPPRLFATIRWAKDERYAFVRGEVVGKHDRPGPTERTRPSRASADLGWGFALGRVADLRFVVSNVANASYVSSPDEVADIAPGRSLAITVGSRR